MRNRGCSLPPSATEWTATGGPRGKGWDGWGSRAHCALWKIRGELTPRPDTWLGQLTRRQQRILLTTALYAHVGLGTEILLRAAGVRDDGAVVSALRPRIHTPEPIVEKVARQHRIQRLRRHAMPGGRIGPSRCSCTPSAGIYRVLFRGVSSGPGGVGTSPGHWAVAVEGAHRG